MDDGNMVSLGSTWEIEIDQICAYKMPLVRVSLVGVFLGARFSWKDFFLPSSNLYKFPGKGK